MFLCGEMRLGSLEIRAGMQKYEDIWRNKGQNKGSNQKPRLKKVTEIKKKKKVLKTLICLTAQIFGPHSFLC